MAAVVERDLSSLPYHNLTVHQGVAASLSTQTQQILLRDGSKLSYDKLCICTGAIPKVGNTWPLLANVECNLGRGTHDHAIPMTLSTIQPCA